MFNGAGFVYGRRPPALDRRRRDGRGAPADRPAGLGRGAGLVAGRHADRLRHEPRPRTATSAGTATSTSSTSRPGPGPGSPVGAATSAPRLAARRPDAGGPRSPLPAARRQSRRHLAVRGRRLRERPARRAEPVRPARPDARLGDEQRPHDRRGAAPGRDRATAGRSCSARRSRAPTSSGGSPSPTARSSG